jgi:hypothetical protein
MTKNRVLIWETVEGYLDHLAEPEWYPVSAVENVVDIKESVTGDYCIQTSEYSLFLPKSVVFKLEKVG